MRRSAYLLCAALLVAAPAWTQDASLVPGLRSDLERATNDTARADALARICFNLIRSQPDSARLVGEQAMALAKKIGNPRALGDAHNNLGWLAAERGEFVRADSLLHIALDIFQRIGRPEFTSVTLSNLGWLADKRGDQVGSLKHFQEALALSELAKDSASTSKLYYSIGIAYRKSGDNVHALEFLERSLGMERALGRRNAEATCLVGIANTHRELGDTIKATAAYLQAGPIFDELDDHYGAGLVHENLGDMESERAPEKALHAYALALNEYDAVESRIDKAYVLLRIGLAELQLARSADADRHLQEGMALADGAGDPSLIMDYALALARLARQKGDAEGTFSHYARYVSLKDSLQGEGTQRELARLRTEFDTERKEKDNALLRAANSEKTERLRRRDLQLYGSIALAVLAAVAATLFWRNYRQKRAHADILEELNRQLAHNNTEIREINGLLEMKVLRGQMNPHFIYNCLNSAAQMTQAGRSAAALSYLQDFARLLRMVLDHSVKDRISLHEELDFLRQYLQLEAHRLEDLRYEVEADPALLEDDAELPALMVQPFVENAVWHGLVEKPGLRSLSVRFEQEDGALICSITDNGIGRDRSGSAIKVDPRHRSLGMQLTQERLRLLSRRLGGSGSFAVEDLKDPAGEPRGTRVTLRLPLNA